MLSTYSTRVSTSLHVPRLCKGVCNRLYDCDDLKQDDWQSGSCALANGDLSCERLHVFEIINVEMRVCLTLQGGNRYAWVAQ
jgi:hypothetical protein